MENIDTKITELEEALRFLTEEIQQELNRIEIEEAQANWLKKQIPEGLDADHRTS